MVDEPETEKLLDPNVVVSVVRLAPRFVDGFGGKGNGHGTGFWVTVDRRPYLVTNKHVVDARVSEPGSPFRLDKFEIELRRRVGPPGRERFASETKYFEVKNLPQALFVSETADSAILADPDLGETGAFGPCDVIEHYHLGTAYQFEFHYVTLLDPVFFVGYPRSSKDELPWWDTAWNLPIARDATIASVPELPFTNPKIRTADVLLVSGLSLQGSSGSPVFTRREQDVVVTNEFDHQGGGAERRERTRVRDVEPILIGIMSGHFPDPEAGPLNHSGLSYVTRSTSILDLIEKARAVNLRNPDPTDALEFVRERRMKGV